MIDFHCIAMSTKAAYDGYFFCMHLFIGGGFCMQVQKKAPLYLVIGGSKIWVKYYERKIKTPALRGWSVALLAAACLASLWLGGYSYSNSYWYSYFAGSACRAVLLLCCHWNWNIYWLLKLFYKVAEYIGYYLVCYFVLAHIFALFFGAAFAYVFFGKIVFVIHWEA